MKLGDCYDTFFKTVEGRERTTRHVHITLGPEAKIMDLSKNLFSQGNNSFIENPQTGTFPQLKDGFELVARAPLGTTYLDYLVVNQAALNSLRMSYTSPQWRVVSVPQHLNPKHDNNLFFQTDW